MSTISAGTTTTTALINTGDTTGKLVFQTNGTTTAMTIDTSQNVGIGTSSPGGRLDVSGADNTVMFFRNATASIRLRPYVPSYATSQIAAVNAAGSAYTPLAIGGSYTTIETNGIERMRIDSSGLVGIGTTSPTGIIDVTGSGVASASNWAYIRAGNVGSNNPSISAGVAIGANFSNGNSETNLVWGQTIGSQQYFSISKWTGSVVSEQMRLDSNGNLLVGLTSIGAQIRFAAKGASTSSGDYTTFFTNSAGTTTGFIRNDGAFNTGVASLSPYNLTTASAANLFVDSGGTLYRSTSSLKYKTDVQDATHGLADVLKLRPVTYKGKNDGDKVFGGLIAEEVHEAGLTEFVQYAEDGSPDALHYGNMVSVLVKAIQELKTQNDELRARVAALEGK